MDQQSSAEARPEYYDPFQQPPRHDPSWDPMAPTPDLTYPSPPPQRSRVSFAPASPPPGNTGAGAETPSSVGLGIESGGQFPGYHPVVSRDSFQQDSPPGTPTLANDSSKTTISPQEYELNSPYGAAYYYPPHYDASPPPGPPGNPRFAWLTRTKGWKLVYGGWPMYAMFCLGFAFALGHHIFYLHLDGKPADDQIRMMRFGGLLSYAAKASLVAAVVFAYRQQIWTTVILNVLRLKTIDSLFSAVDEPLMMLNWEFLKKGRAAACLAVLAWLFPLTVILTPATLTVAPITEIREEMCHGIRTLNFEHEKTKNWRNVDRVNGVRGVSLSLWNCTFKDSRGLVDTPFNETFFDYWTESSAQVDLTTAQSALTHAVIPRRDAALETCGSGWNCSYTISFKAPGYKCAERARGAFIDDHELHKQGLPINASQLMPMGNLSYWALTNLGDYFRYQINLTNDGIPSVELPYPKHFGALRTEPVLLIGHSVPKTPDKLPGNKTAPGWDTAYEAVVFQCEHYLTNYTVNFNHTLSQQTTTILKREYLHPIIDTTYQPDILADDGTRDVITATPQSNYVLPVDAENYRLVFAYHSLGKRLRAYLEGIITFAPSAQVESSVTKTSLIDPETYIPFPTLMADIQQFYENMTLSLLSNPQFVVVAWAADPSRPGRDDGTGTGTGNATSGPDPALAYPCTRTRVANAYAYNRRDLWIAYAFAMGAATFAVVLGSAALSQNNFHVRDVHLSSIVAATRAPCLEGLPWKASRWGEVSDEILAMKLGYGVVAEPGPNGTPAATAVGLGTPGGRGWGEMGSPRVVGGKVYYGFAPREVLERTRVATFGPGQPRARGSAFSFRTWEHTWAGGRK